MGMERPSSDYADTMKYMCESASHHALFGHSFTAVGELGVGFAGNVCRANGQQDPQQPLPPVGHAHGPPHPF